MGASKIGVEVEHLRLEPEPELHPQRAHVLDERAQSDRPHVRRHHPVAETSLVVAARPEPAVVEDEPLDADRRGGVGEALEVIGIGVEVHRLPGVEDQRTRTSLVLVGSGPLEPGEATGEPVEAVARPHEHDLGSLVGLPRLEPDLARCEELAPSEDSRVHARRLGEPLDHVLVVAAPRDVGRPHLAVPEAEPCGPRDEEQGGVVAGAAAPSLPGEGAVGQEVALRLPLPDPPAGEVEDLVGPDRQGHQGPEGGDVEGGLLRRSGGRHRGRHVQDAVLVEAIVEQDLGCGGRRRGLHPDVGPVGRHRRSPAGRRCTPCPVQRDPGSAEPALAGRREDREVPGVVEGVVRDRPLPQRQQVRDGVVGEVAAPVQDRRQALTVLAKDEEGTAAAQRRDGRHPLVEPNVSPETNCFCRNQLEPVAPLVDDPHEVERAQ